MSGFVRDRGPWLAAVVGIMFAVSVAQTGISYTMAFGGLSGLLPKDRSGMAAILILLRFGLVALMVGLWALSRQRALFRAIIVANALFTLALLVHTSSLIAALFGGASEAVNTLLLDVVLMAASYILIFSVWYWVIDPPGVKDIPRADGPWHFLFPQRAGVIPGYESWAPRYGDYCPHDQLHLQPIRDGAAPKARQGDHDAAGGHFGRFIDSYCRQRDQHSRRRQMIMVPMPAARRVRLTWRARLDQRPLLTIATNRLTFEHRNSAGRLLLRVKKFTRSDELPRKIET